MNTYKGLVTAAMLTAAATLQAQDLAASAQGENLSGLRQTRVPVQLIIKNYVKCLDSDLPPIVESALGHVACMRIALPSEDLGAIQEKLVELTTRGATRAIRYKAFAALEVFGDPATFRRYVERKNGCGDGLLDEIAGRILPKSDLVAR